MHKIHINIPASSPDINYGNEMLRMFWKFIAERQKIFYRKLAGDIPPWTQDATLAKYKFTNVYRASDRISQYLIRNVILPYSDDYPEEIVFRILLFKIFNLESTWDYIVKNIGKPSLQTFSVEEYGKLLDDCDKLFNNAYMMTGSKVYGYDRKHWNYLTALYNLMQDANFMYWISSSNPSAMFVHMIGRPLIAEFLAYQFITDINYSDVVKYSENDFVYPGKGTVRGLCRVFNLLESDAENLGDRRILELVENQDVYMNRYAVNVETLFGRKLHAPDIANCFCEFDKYCREKLPSQESYGKVRIKQNYILDKAKPKIDYIFPTKWSISQETIDSYIDKYKTIQDGGDLW